MKFRSLNRSMAFGVALLATMPLQALASSHMDAPLITQDDPANTTDVYAFRSQSEDGEQQYLTVALSVNPFEEPGIGPNNYSFDDEVLYELHVALGDDAPKGRSTISYQFNFNTKYQNRDTIRQAFLGPIESVFGDNQNLRQSYRVTKVDRRSKGNKRRRTSRTTLGKDLMVPPNNQGQVTRFYNTGDNGENTAKEGVQSEANLDIYTRASIFDIKDGYRVFAGQRDDGFFADIQSIFDLDLTFTGANKPFDSQAGFNVHTIVLNIPMEEFGDETVAGVYATTSRRRVEVLSSRRDPVQGGSFVQVARQGNPLFNEGFVPVRDKDRYSRTSPTGDSQTFRTYADNVELVALVPGLLAGPVVEGIIAGIFIPDLIKVDLTTGPARTPNDARFDRLGGVLAILGGSPDVDVDDVLVNADGQPVFGGWPNGRRFGDDVLDIALLAVGSGNTNVDGVTANDITYNDVFPYAATPLNGRSHPHHSAPVQVVSSL